MMRYLLIILMISVVSFSSLVCKKEQQAMTLSDFAKIEEELNLPDPELDKERVEQISSKHGFSYDQYKELFDKVENDPSLREKLGESKLEPKEEKE